MKFRMKSGRRNLLRAIKNGRIIRQQFIKAGQNRVQIFTNYGLLSAVHFIRENSINY